MKKKAVVPTRWEIFIPARPGPNRSVKKIIDGVEFRAKVKRPELPPNQNERLNWRVKAKITADWRATSALAAKTAGVPNLQRVNISAIFHRRTIGRADWSGDLERLKPIVDGLVDAGVVPDDRRKYVTYGSVDEQKWDERGLGITIILERVNDSAS